MMEAGSCTFPDASTVEPRVAAWGTSPNGLSIDPAHGLHTPLALSSNECRSSPDHSSNTGSNSNNVWAHWRRRGVRSGGDHTGRPHSDTRLLPAVLSPLPWLRGLPFRQPGPQPPICQQTRHERADSGALRRHPPPVCVPVDDVRVRIATYDAHRHTLEALLQAAPQRLAPQPHPPRMAATQAMARAHAVPPTARQPRRVVVEMPPCQGSSTR